MLTQLVLLLCAYADVVPAQVAFNRVSYSFPEISSVLSNLVGLGLFLLLAAVLLWLHMRSHVRLFAEAVAVTKTSDIEQVR
jgi:hypothetical protein